MITKVHGFFTKILALRLELVGFFVFVTLFMKYRINRTRKHQNRYKPLPVGNVIGKRTREAGNGIDME